MRALSGLFSATLLVCGVAFCLWQLAVHPETPLPREWNPSKRLYLDDPVTLLTPYKLKAAANDPPPNAISGKASRGSRISPATIVAPFVASVTG